MEWEIVVSQYPNMTPHTVKVLVEKESSQMEVRNTKSSKFGVEMTTLIGRKFVSDFYEQLIPLVRKKPSLWDKKNPGYMNHGMSRAIWNQIGKVFKMSGSDVRKKWKNVRDTYRKELYKLSELQILNPRTLSKWKHFESLDFLRAQFLGSEDNSTTPQDQLERHDDIPEPIVIADDENSSLNDASEHNDESECQEYAKAEPEFSEEPTYEEDQLQSENGELTEDQLASMENFNNRIVFKYGNPYHSMQSQELIYKDRRSDLIDETCIQNILMKVQDLENRLMGSLECEDDDYHFLLSLLPTLRDFPRERKMTLRTKIQQVFCDEFDLLKKSK